MIQAIGATGVLALIIKIIIHSYLLIKVGKIRFTAPQDLSRLQYLVPIWFDVPPDLQFIKFLANIFHAIAFLCFAFVLTAKFLALKKA